LKLLHEIDRSSARSIRRETDRVLTPLDGGFFKAAAAQVAFVKDAAGTITHAVISAGGRDIKAVHKP
jgi:hypothetical protein